MLGVEEDRPARSGRREDFLAGTNAPAAVCRAGITVDGDGVFHGDTLRATLADGYTYDVGFSGGCDFTGVESPVGITKLTAPGRKLPQNAGGTDPSTCDGAYAEVVNDGAPSDPGPGNTAWYQRWYRDPQNGAGNLGTALSNAAEVPYQ